MKHRLHEINPNTFAFEGSPDALAVMGAKTSRAPDIRARFEDLWRLAGGDEWELDEAPETLSSFLRKNLAGYGHASIAEMAPGWVHNNAMGWPGEWLLTDSPLFVGQVTSSRAVDMRRVPGSDAPCDFTGVSPELHRQWLALYGRVLEVVRDNETPTTTSKGYRFDGIRDFLPGSTRMGVTMVMMVRQAIRHLEQMGGVSPEMMALAGNFIEGFRRLAPESVNAISKPGREGYLGRYEVKVDGGLEEGDLTTVANGVLLDFSPYHASPTLRYTVPAGVRHRKGQGEYLDPRWSKYCQLNLTITGTAGALRAWHRHRACMPWDLTVPLLKAPKDEGGGHKILFAPKTQMDLMSLHGGVQLMAELWRLQRESAAEFIRLGGLRGEWDALHALPLGAVVSLECTTTLPALVYMLELRAFASGAHGEYQAQAMEGLKQLRWLLGERIAELEHISPERL